jgi:hypothetical protein
MAAFVWTLVFLSLLIAPAIYNWWDQRRIYRRECEEFEHRHMGMPD